MGVVRRVYVEKKQDINTVLIKSVDNNTAYDASHDIV